jgi:CRP-like cAMP-binding protein
MWISIRLHRPLVARAPGTAETSVNFADAFGQDAPTQRALSALQRGPLRFYRDNVVADDNLADYLLFVVRGVVRSCQIDADGARIIVAFYLPGDLFGWTDLKNSVSIEAATDAEVLFIKRCGFLSLASDHSRLAGLLLNVTIKELARAQEHITLKSKTARCRTATFITDLWERLGKPKYLDVPMSGSSHTNTLGGTHTHRRDELDQRLRGLSLNTL